MIKTLPLIPILAACVASQPCACAPAPSRPAPSPISIIWSDGDSGRYIQDGAEIAFRVHGMDTAETGRSKKRYLPARPNGPRCADEWRAAIKAYAHARALTDDQPVTITRQYGADRFNRQVLDLAVNGQDYADTMVAAGHAQNWDFDGGQAKPDWCKT